MCTYQGNINGAKKNWKIKKTKGKNEKNTWERDFNQRSQDQWFK
jgi:hypothetical protein